MAIQFLSDNSRKGVDMLIVNEFTGGFTTQYSRGVIEKSTVNYLGSGTSSDNSITFYYYSGEIKSFRPHIRLSSYHSQFGIAVTLDGTCFFIQCWDSGKLFCYRIIDNTLVWSASIKHPRHLIVQKECVVCYSMGNGIYKIAIHDGACMDRLPYSRMDGNFLPVGENKFLIGPIRSMYQLWNTDFLLISSIPKSVMNPTGFKTFIVNKAEESCEGLCVSGFEYTIEYRVPTAEEIDQSRFCRYIDLERGHGDGLREL